MSRKSWKGCKIFKGSCTLNSWIKRFKLGEVWSVDVALGVVPFSFHICFSGGHTVDLWVHEDSTAVSHCAISLKRQSQG